MCFADVLEEPKRECCDPPGSLLLDYLTSRSCYTERKTNYLLMLSGSALFTFDSELDELSRDRWRFFFFSI